MHYLIRMTVITFEFRTLLDKNTLISSKLSDEGNTEDRTANSKFTKKVSIVGGHMHMEDIRRFRKSRQFFVRIRFY